MLQALACCIALAGQPTFGRTSQEPELTGLLSACKAAAETPDRADNRPAIDKLDAYMKKLPPTAEQRQQVYACAVTIPASDDTYDDMQARLVISVREAVSPEDGAMLRPLIEKLGPYAKAHAVINLSIPESRGAAVAFADCAVLASKDPKIEFFNLGSYTRSLRHPDALLPKLYALADNDSTAFALYSSVLNWVEADQLPKSYRKGLLENVLNTHARMLARQKEQEGKPDIEGHPAFEHDASHGIEGVLLDLLGFFPGKNSVRALREGMTLKSPELRLWAATSLLQLKEQVDEADLESIADNIDMRYKLLRILDGKGQSSRFPAKYRTNLHIAEAHMWDWLRHPNELGESPQKLELGKAVTMKDDAGNDVEYFVFKFLPRKSEDGGDQPAEEPTWQMGVSGPYLKVPGFDTEGGEDTFSDFLPWNEKDAEQEIERIRTRMAESWKLHQEMLKKKQP